jgi:hypothetical protein
MSSGQGGGEVEIHLCSSKFDENDEGWISQQRRFYAELRRDTGAASLNSVPQQGSKGSAETIIVALGSAGVFSSAVSLFQSWLARDRTRRIELRWKRNGQADSFLLEGNNIGEETFARLAVEISKAGVRK